MNAGNLSHRFVAPVLALAVAGAMLVLGSQSASAQRITVSTPFPFSVDSQHYPAGTYQFTLISECLLSILKVDRGEEKVFLIRPEANGPLGAHGGLTFDNSKGHRTLQSVFIPGKAMAAELVGNETARNAGKDHIRQTSTNSLPQRVANGKRGATGQ